MESNLAGMEAVEHGTRRTYWDSIAVKDGNIPDKGRTMCLLKS